MYLDAPDPKNGEVFLTSYRGKTFKIVHGVHPASVFTFVDEQIVRDTIFKIEPDEMLFDIGCAFGSYAMSALAIGIPFAYCWAPDEENIRVFKLSLAENGWSDRVKISTSGLWTASGWLNETTRELSPVEQPALFKVTSLDEVVLDPVPTKGRCWIKIDTEGAEEGILRGAVKFMELYRPKITLENHNFLLPNSERDTRAFLETQGYEHISTTPHHGVSHSLYYPR